MGYHAMTEQAYEMVGAGRESFDYLVEEAKDAHDLVSILDKAVHALYRSQPDGEQNYSLSNELSDEYDDPEIGVVFLERSATKAIAMLFRSIKAMKDMKLLKEGKLKWHELDYELRFGWIDLRERRLALSTEVKTSGRRTEKLPEVLINDTKAIAEILGLEYQQDIYAKSEEE